MELNIIGQEKIKKYLLYTIKTNRIPNALFFVGPEGCGTLPMALVYIKYLFKYKNINPFYYLNHPDVYCLFPIPLIYNKNFLSNWITFIKKNPYGSLFNWINYLNLGNKHIQIRVEETKEIIKNIYLKSYKDTRKVVIIWIPELLHIAAANKLLKIMEEPPSKTIFLLIGENEENVLSTIRSRTQIIRFNKLTFDQIKNALQKEILLNEKQSEYISSKVDGNWNIALELSKGIENNKIFEIYFNFFIQNVLKAKSTPKVLKNFLKLSEFIHKWEKEKKKKFLIYCLEIFRKILISYYLNKKIDNIDNSKYLFSLINIKNIQNIISLINEAIYHINKNANSKIVIFDLSIKITKSIYNKY
ncbi:MAG: DNA polymerase III subunit delta' [Candidatus Bostrichicola ureolyticus]|nr:MAG: DNA polymerase III subunit delta' [Candidatus Bostrichicola ureolyticus]